MEMAGERMCMQVHAHLREQRASTCVLSLHEHQVRVHAAHANGAVCALAIPSASPEMLGNSALDHSFENEHSKLSIAFLFDKLMPILYKLANIQ